MVHEPLHYHGFIPPSYYALVSKIFALHDTTLRTCVWITPLHLICSMHDFISCLGFDVCVCHIPSIMIELPLMLDDETVIQLRFGGLRSISKFTTFNSFSSNHGLWPLFFLFLWFDIMASKFYYTY